MAHDVFVSYSTHDKTTADAVCATLEAHGIRCWIAPRNITPGMDWSEAIIDAIHTSRVMILVFSSHANDSQQIRREVERAANGGLLIMPLRIENVTPTKSLAYFIGSVHWLDALTPPLENHLQNLAEAVRLLLSRLGQDKGTIVREQRPTQTQARPARGRFKKTAIGLMVLFSLGLGLTFYGLWHPVDRKKTEETEQQGREAACYDEAVVNSLVDILQKTTEVYKEGLIDIVDLQRRRNKLLNDLHHLMAQGPDTQTCILQELELVGSLYKKGFIDIAQWQRSKSIIEKPGLGSD